MDGLYRIIGLLGRGGMGEVYRADDMRLGQQVALKLLPESLASDPQRLAQFHNEVRTARQVSHPNVCRVYDIGDLAVETDGSVRHQLFITMEYVDGEDLSVLLRRIGRLPEHKAIEIARQVCAGLAAAHGRGVVHRDLKPANIMLDNAGQARIMDFSLAAVGAVTDVRSGTPAYMAPEQLSGAGVTAVSDVFALGLVLYELFTGQRAYPAATLGDLIAQHQTGAVTPPASLVAGLDPAIDRAIMRCLRPDPAERPQSAMAVSAALPGGDPLAMAIAAGETPSPQMVAAAGEMAPVMSVAARLGWLTAALALLVVTAILSSRLSLNAAVPFDRSPATLFDRARDIERTLVDPGSVVDRASFIATRNEFLAWQHANQTPAEALATLKSGRPPGLVFSYRSSPSWLVPNGAAVTTSDPPPIQAGMIGVVLDLEGRLLSFERLPDLLVRAVPESTPSVDWAPYLEAAGIDPAGLLPATPTYSPRAFADARQAWTGRWPNVADAVLRVEAGSYLGKPVYFRTFGPWNPTVAAPGDSSAGAAPGPAAGGVTLVSVLSSLVVLSLLVAAAMVARANLKRDRGDRHGAIRLAIAVASVSLVGWILRAHHVPDADVEQSRLFTAFGEVLFSAGTVWLLYLAAEPLVRRTWPHILITWSRLLGGRYFDPLVGRDLLLGVTVGVAMTAISFVFHLLPHWLSWPPFEPPMQTMVLGTRHVLALTTFHLSAAIFNATLGVLGLALLRAALGRLSSALNHTGVAFGVATLLFTPLATQNQFESGIAALNLCFGLILAVLILGLIFRFGLFAGVIGFFTHFLSWAVAITLDAQRPYFDGGLAALALIAVIGVTGFVLTRSPARAI